MTLKQDGVAEGSAGYGVVGDYEHEHRLAEHEHEVAGEPEPSDEPKRKRRLGS
jgi:hypothetical protein